MRSLVQSAAALLASPLAASLVHATFVDWLSRRRRPKEPRLPTEALRLQVTLPAVPLPA